MGKALVIVESPTKAKTITRFLGKDFEVHACLGHVRALPSKQGSVDIANDFEPNYEILPQSKKYLKGHCRLPQALRYHLSCHRP